MRNEVIMFFTTTEGNIFVFQAVESPEKITPIGPGYYRSKTGDEIPNIKNKGKRPYASKELSWAIEEWNKKPEPQKLENKKILEKITVLFEGSRDLSINKHENRQASQSPFSGLNELLKKS